MDYAVLVDIAKETGIAGVAIGSVVYLTIRLRKSHREEMEAERKERREGHLAFMAFVESNNHQKTELVRESTAAIVEARKSIEVHTKLLENYISMGGNNYNNK